MLAKMKQDHDSTNLRNDSILSAQEADLRLHYKAPNADNSGFQNLNVSGSSDPSAMLFGNFDLKGSNNNSIIQTLKQHSHSAGQDEEDELDGHGDAEILKSIKVEAEHIDVGVGTEALSNLNSPFSPEREQHSRFQEDVEDKPQVHKLHVGLQPIKNDKKNGASSPRRCGIGKLKSPSNLTVPSIKKKKDKEKDIQTIAIKGSQLNIFEGKPQISKNESQNIEVKGGKRSPAPDAPTYQYILKQKEAASQQDKNNEKARNMDRNLGLEDQPMKNSQIVSTQHLESHNDLSSKEYKDPPGQSIINELMENSEKQSKFQTLMQQFQVQLSEKKLLQDSAPDSMGNMNIGASHQGSKQEISKMSRYKLDQIISNSPLDVDKDKSNFANKTTKISPNKSLRPADRLRLKKHGFEYKHKNRQKQLIDSFKTDLGGFGNLTTQQIQSIKNQLGGELKNGLDGLAVEAAIGTITSMVPTQDDSAKKHAENLVPGGGQYTNRSSVNIIDGQIHINKTINIEKSKVHPDNRQNAEHIRHHIPAEKGHGRHRKNYGSQMDTGKATSISTNNQDSLSNQGQNLIRSLNPTAGNSKKQLVDHPFSVTKNSTVVAGRSGSSKEESTSKDSVTANVNFNLSQLRIIGPQTHSTNMFGETKSTDLKQEEDEHAQLIATIQYSAGENKNKQEMPGPQYLSAKNVDKSHQSFKFDDMRKPAVSDFQWAQAFNATSVMARNRKQGPNSTMISSNQLKQSDYKYLRNYKLLEYHKNRHDQDQILQSFRRKFRDGEGYAEEYEQLKELKNNRYKSVASKVSGDLQGKEINLPKVDNPRLLSSQNFALSPPFKQQKNILINEHTLNTKSSLIEVSEDRSDQQKSQASINQSPFRNKNKLQPLHMSFDNENYKVPPDVDFTDLQGSSDSLRSQATFMSQGVKTAVDQNNNTSRFFLIGSSNVEMPTETLDSMINKHNRVNTMALNLHEIKAQVRDQFFIKQFFSTKQAKIRQPHKLGKSCNYTANLKLLDKREMPSQLSQLAKLRQSEIRSSLLTESKTSIQGAVSPDGRSIISEAEKINFSNQSATILSGDHYASKEQVNTTSSPRANKNATEQQKPDQEAQRSERPKLKNAGFTQDELEFFQYLDRRKAEREQNHRDHKDSIKEFIHNAPLDSSSIVNKFDALVSAVTTGCTGAHDDAMQMIGTRKDLAFAPEFEKSEAFMDFCLRNKDFAAVVQQIDPQVRQHLNLILKELQGCGSPDPLEFISQEESQTIKIAPKDAPKRTWKNVLLSRIGSNESFVKKVAQKKALFQEIISKSLRKKIVESLYDHNIGTKYDQIGENIFVNDKRQRNDPEYANLVNNAQDQALAQEQKLKDNSFDAFFADQVQKKKFYDQAKQGRISEKIYRIEAGVAKATRLDDEQKLATIMLEYFQGFHKGLGPAAPMFVHSLMTKGILHLSEFRIDDQQANCLGRFFASTRRLSRCWVRTLIVDEVGMTDSQFSAILEGLADQGYRIRKIIYSNNQFGELSLRSVDQLIGYLEELQITNVKRCSCRGPEGLSQSQVFDELLSTCFENDKKLAKLKLSKLNLNHQMATEDICGIRLGSAAGDDLSAMPMTPVSEEQVDTKVNVSIKKIYELLTITIKLSHLDLAWTGLQPKQLLCISDALKGNKTMRSLNLSYNTLLFEDSSPSGNAVLENRPDDVKYSNQFIDNFVEFLEQNDNFNHVDLSGMGFKREQLIKLALGIAQHAPMLLALHLNDVGLNDENMTETRLEVLDIFGFNEGQEALIDQDHGKDPANPQRVVNPGLLKKVVRQTCLKFKQEDQKDPTEPKVHSYDYPNHLLRSKLTKRVAQSKMINQAQVSCVTGDNTSDQFILTRKINHAELVFNQAPTKNCHFEVDASQKWKLRKECYVCSKHHYVAIWYNQGAGDQNTDLHEIKDAGVVASVQAALGLSIKDGLVNAPFLVGFGSAGFSRKARMLRGDLFALLSVSQSGRFMTTPQASTNLKNGIVRFTENSQLIANEEILEKLKGWNKVLNHKFAKNFLTDVLAVNLPKDLDKKQPKDTCFVYSGYLPAGYHSFLIFDHAQKPPRLFCKDIVVDLNSQDFQPEFPNMLAKMRPKRQRQNVWRTWVEDSGDDLRNIFLNDITSGTYEPALFIKNEETIKEIHAQLLENFRVFQVVYKEMLSRSLQYPRVDYASFEGIMSAFAPGGKGEAERLSRQQFELAFIKASRNQNTGKLKGSLSRAETLECLLRCLSQLYYKKEGEQLDDFMKDYCLPPFRESRMLLYRRKIRSSRPLNSLLLKNKKNIYQVFKRYAAADHGHADQGLHLEEAKNLIAQLKVPLAPEDTKQVFVFSKMTVRNENDPGEVQKYSYLVYVEFLEFLCRVALRIDDSEDLQVHEKVLNLLAILFDYFFDGGASDVGSEDRSYELFEPDPDSDASDEEDKQDALRLKTLGAQLAGEEAEGCGQ